MDLAAAIAQRMPVKAITEGGERLVSHIHVDADAKRVVWAEKDWLTNQDTHGVHLIEGQVTGSGPWRVGGIAFEQFGEDDKYTLVMGYANMVADEKQNGHDYDAAVKLLSGLFR